jgi:hypothetical protein
MEQSTIFALMLGIGKTTVQPMATNTVLIYEASI